MPSWGVVLDADVLLRSSARDLFLYLATLGVVDPIWSEQIMEEVARNFPTHPEMIQRLSADSLRRAQDLVGHIEVDPNEDLGDDVTIG